MEKDKKRMEALCVRAGGLALLFLRRDLGELARQLGTRWRVGSDLRDHHLSTERGDRALSGSHARDP